MSAGCELCGCEVEQRDSSGRARVEPVVHCQRWSFTPPAAHVPVIELDLQAHYSCFRDAVKVRFEVRA